MQNVTRHLCLAVLLALLVGHASFAVHAASHGVGEAVDCELCISYGDASEALAQDPEHEVRPRADARTRQPVADEPATTAVYAFSQRGPPVSD